MNCKTMIQSQASCASFLCADFGKGAGGGASGGGVGEGGHSGQVDSCHLVF